MFDNLDSILEFGHIVCICLVFALLVSVESTLRVVECEVDVLLALELVCDAFDHFDQRQTVVYLLHVVVQFVGLDFRLHCFGALAPNDRV